MPAYEDFVVTVDGAVGSYTVAAQGPADIRVAPVPFAFAETAELQADLVQIKHGSAPSRERMVVVGTALFDALFPRSVQRAWDRARGGLAAGISLRLKVISRPPELNHLPWELLYDPEDQLFLAARLSYPLVRAIETGTASASLLAPQPLRVLYVHANPQGTHQLNLAASEQALRDALGDRAAITAVHNATPAMLRDMLREAPGFHILHYDGHGKFDDARAEGYLALHDATGNLHRLSGEQLALYLDGSSVRLLVLAACETGMDSNIQRFMGVAQQVMRGSSLPAVVAMQWAIADSSAIAFTAGFYAALADRYPVDAAVIEGRKAILERLGGSAGRNLTTTRMVVFDDDTKPVYGDAAFAAPDWATPVLFMRTEDGNIFQPDKELIVMSDEKRDRDPSPKVETGGGNYFGGAINTGGGEFTGGNKTVHGNEVRGNQVSGEQFNIGTISGGTNAFGRGAQATHNQGLGATDLKTLFADIYRQIEARPANPNVDKDELSGTVQKIEAEASTGDAANTTKLERWFKSLLDIAPDVLDVTVAALANPLAGTAIAIRKLAERFKGQVG